MSFDGGAIEIKLFKKGTLHIKVEDSVARGLNRILSKSQNYALCDGERASKKEAKKVKKIIPIEKMISQNTSDFLFNLERSRYISKEKLTDDALEAIYISGGKVVDGKIVSDDLDSFFKSIRKIALKRSLPTQKGNQFYPTPENIQDYIAQSVCVEGKRVLEPSAGRGDLLMGFKRDGQLKGKDITCIEISDAFCEVLKNKEFGENSLDVVNANFIEWSEKNRNQFFDAIIMNPPYTKSQARDHLQTALKHLNEDGVVVAVLPASMKDQEFEGFISHSQEFQDSFDNTGVNVVVKIFNKKP